MNIRNLTSKALAGYIQFTKTAPSVTREEMVKHFEISALHQFHAAMVPMYYVSLGKDVLQGTGVRVATFFGFGMGHETIRAKMEMIPGLSERIRAIKIYDSMGYLWVKNSSGSSY